jgi:Flp pilus assembly protein TadD
VVSLAPGKGARLGVWILAVGYLLGCSSGCAWWREARDSLAYSQSLSRRALECEARGDHAEAVKLMRDSIEAAPDDPELRWELACLLIDHGETAEALEELRFLVRYYPDDSRAYMSLARTLLERGRPDDAARLADLAIDLDSRCTEALLLRGQIAEVRGDFELAFETYHRILLEQPELTDVRLKLASLELEQGEPRIAAALLRETLADFPVTPEQARSAQWLLGTAYARESRWKEAQTALALGMPDGSASANQHYELAFACFQAGDADRARQELALAMQAQPTFAPARQLLAELQIPRTHSTSSPLTVLPTGHSESP